VAAERQEFCGCGLRLQVLVTESLLRATKQATASDRTTIGYVYSYRIICYSYPLSLSAYEVFRQASKIIITNN
jgi:hypothetical protein